MHDVHGEALLRSLGTSRRTVGNVEYPPLTRNSRGHGRFMKRGTWQGCDTLLLYDTLLFHNFPSPYNALLQVNNYPRGSVVRAGRSQVLEQAYSTSRVNVLSSLANLLALTLHDVSRDHLALFDSTRRSLTKDLKCKVARERERYDPRSQFYLAILVR